MGGDVRLPVRLALSVVLSWFSARGSSDAHASDRLVGAYPRCVYERVLQTVVSSGLDNSTSLLVERVE